MKISLNWLKKFVKVPESVPDEDLIKLIGARLVEVEGVIDETHKYDNIFVVKVVSCERIPETHLTKCMIDAGDSSASLVQVVCGAPNVREGMLAVWIAPGAIVPASVHEDAPFVIGKRKMRGFESSGMLAGADELDFGDDHSGIVEIDPEMAKPGDPIADVFDLNDLVLEIENKSLTHRPDTFGIIGFAREVAGILGQKFEETVFTDENTAELAKIFDNESVKRIKISIDKDICPRYTAVVLEKHGELKKKYLTLVDILLSKSGVNVISPIVDATNYLMLLTGQPLHAFDYDKLVSVGKSEEPVINVRLAKNDEKIVLLDDSEIILNENDIVICSGDIPVALAGAMGGKSTMIDDETKNIIIESATFSLYNLRKTQMSHGIFSEAITRFTKGQPPYQTPFVAKMCAEMLSSGFQVSAAGDVYPEADHNTVVKITTDEINGLLGTDYSKETIVKTLKNVGFGISDSDGFLEIKVPSWRTDIHIKEDIIEEVGRLLGYDNIKPVLPLHATSVLNPMWELKKHIRSEMLKFGANEVLTYSFVSERLLNMAGLDENNSYRITNSLSPELQFIRQSIVPSLLDKAYTNEKLPVERFAIFEMNKVYPKDYGFNDEKVPEEKNTMGFVVAERKGKNTAFYLAKKYLSSLLCRLGVSAEYVPMNNSNSVNRPFEPKRSADVYVGETPIGVVGEFKNSVKNQFKLAEFVAGFEIDLDAILALPKNNKKIEFKETKKEDLTITTDKTYAEVLKDVQEKYPEAKITPGTIYQPIGLKSKNITFHIETVKKQ